MNKLFKVREKLKNGQLCFGTHCSTTDADFYEMCGLLGYDYVWIDNEHAGMTQPMIKNAIIATNAGGSCAFVRVPDHQMAHVKPVIECGPDGVIFPMVNTPEQAAHCVSICTYPPKGTRGFGPLRAIDYGTRSFADYVATVDDSFLKIMQCEHVEAVKNLDAILEVPGVDAIICGPMDLSVSAGYTAQFSHPHMISLMQTIIDKCKAHGKPFGLSFGGLDMNIIRFFMKEGASFLSLGNPQDYFRETSQTMVSQVRAMEAKRASTNL